MHLIHRAWHRAAAHEHALVAFTRRHVTVRVAFWGVVATSAAVLAALAWAIHGNRVNAAQGLEAHKALCVFKADLEHRAQGSRDFLANPPQTILGIPVTPDVIASVKSDLANREATIRSLSELDCDPASAAPP